MMETRYYQINPDYPQPDLIAEAARVIVAGGLVAFPTETVYGLGANGLDPQAVEKIFAAKGRPRNNPLILHVSSLKQARELVSCWPPEAELLAERFLPGPLTLLLPRSSRVPDQVTAGLPNVAIRFPGNRIALALIEAGAVPIAAPSANTSGRPSPTRVEDVNNDLAGKIDLILDGGATRVGVESTILSLCGERPLLLRPGGVTREQIEELLHQKIDLHPAILQAKAQRTRGEAAPCPGLYFKHYAPRAEAIMVTGEPERQREKILAYLAEHRQQRVAVLGSSEHEQDYRRAAPIYLESLGEREHPERMTRHLFGALRRCDRAGAEVILVETLPTAGIGLAYMNRLCRATANHLL